MLHLTSNSPYIEYLEKNGVTVNYEEAKVYAGSVLCPSKMVYTEDYVLYYMIPNKQPLIFDCPPDTSASTIQFTLNTAAPGYTQFAEIQVFTGWFFEM